jgi:hypothetical protein
MAENACGMYLETVHAPEKPPTIINLNYSKLFWPTTLIVKAMLGYKGVVESKVAVEIVVATTL